MESYIREINPSAALTLASSIRQDTDFRCGAASLVYIRTVSGAADIRPRQPK
jgi:hypothetical protein